MATRNCEALQKVKNMSSFYFGIYRCGRKTKYMYIACVFAISVLGGYFFLEKCTNFDNQYVFPVHRITQNSWIDLNGCSLILQ